MIALDIYTKSNTNIFTNYSIIHLSFRLLIDLLLYLRIQPITTVRDLFTKSFTGSISISFTNLSLNLSIN